MYFKVSNTQSGEPSWWLYGDNNKLVAWAGETFASTYNAERAAASFKAVTHGLYPARESSGQAWGFQFILLGSILAFASATLALPVQHALPRTLRAIT